MWRVSVHPLDILVAGRRRVVVLMLSLGQRKRDARALASPIASASFAGAILRVAYG